VTRGHSGPEKRAHVEHLGVALLVLQEHESHGRAFSLWQVDGSVPNVVEAPSPPLQLVRAIQVVAADDASPLARHGIAIGVVVGRPIRAARDLVVHDPAPLGVVMAARDTLGFRSPVVVIGDAHARLAIRQAAGRAAHG